MSSDLQALRDEIDGLDEVLVRLLDRRARCAFEVGRLKREQGLQIYEPTREASVMAHVKAINHALEGPLDDLALGRLYERIMDEARRIQRIEHDRAAADGSPTPASVRHPEADTTDGGPARIAIVGLGLIGTSIALATRRRWPQTSIIGIDRQHRLVPPHATSACNDVSDDVGAIREAELVVLAAPVDVIAAQMPAVATGARPDAVVTDVGSSKRTIVAAAAAAGVKEFVGGHPMAGAAGGGPESARADLFDRRRWFLIREPHDAALDRVRDFVNALGAHPVVVDADTHDAGVAAGSHLPQIVSSALMRVAGEALQDEGFRFSGSGLADTTRLASSRASMWTSILASNADYLRPLLQRLSRELGDVADRLEDRDRVQELFATANAWKARAQAEA